MHHNHNHIYMCLSLFFVYRCARTGDAEDPQYQRCPTFSQWNRATELGTSAFVCTACH